MTRTRTESLTLPSDPSPYPPPLDQFDIMCLKLEEEGIEKYTRGYMCQSEIVFMMKGLVKGV